MGNPRTVESKKAGKRRGDPFVMVPFKWMDLPAWKALAGNDVLLLLHLIRMSGGDNGARNDRGELFLSERDAARALGLARNTVSRSFVRLTETGWVRPVQKGHFAVKAGEKVLRATVWRLTFQPHPQTRRGPSGEYMRWQPEENSRAQILDSPGSENDPVPPKRGETGSISARAAVDALSVEVARPCSIVEPHIDIARGKRRGGGDSTADKPPVLANDPATEIRGMVAAHWQRLDAAGRKALAASVGLTAPELRDFTEGRLSLSIHKQIALRAETRIAA